MENQAQQVEAPVFNIEKIYVRDLSVEVPNAPQIFLEQEAPQVNVELGTRAQGLGDGVFEVVLTVGVTATLPEDKTLFMVTVEQAGVFRIMNVPDEQIQPLVAVACPNILFPYAREVVSDSVTRAGFSPIVLQPVNFEAMYMAKLQEEAAAEGAPATVQ